MQERYLGDIHDYFKFLFLKHISSCLKTKIGLNWYLVDPNEIGKREIEKNDGEKRTFFNKPKFKNLDRQIIKELLLLRKKSSRKIFLFTKSSHLRFHINFYNNRLHFKNREKWFDNSMKYFKNESIIFLDPDNGFKENYSGAYSLKYVLKDECHKLLKKNKIVIFTQFQSFNKDHKIYLYEIFKNLSKLDLRPTYPIIRNRTAPNTFYITLVPKNSLIDLKKIYENYQLKNENIELIKSFDFSSKD